MELILNEIEARILGALVEKQLTTPEYYPLTLNALRAACNQKSNREPVMGLDDKTIIRGLDSLRNKNLVFEKTLPGSRVFKYEHRLPERISFTPQEVAVLCVLLLRGAQTVGEIKSRTSRFHEFSNSGEVEDTLAALMAHDEGVFAAELPLQPGRREHRYNQLLTGKIDMDDEAIAPAPEAARLDVEAEDERIAQLEETVATLRDELAELKQAFQSFRSEFE